jgi:hypothetical protein
VKGRNIRPVTVNLLMNFQQVVSFVTTTISHFKNTRYVIQEAVIILNTKSNLNDTGSSKMMDQDSRRNIFYIHLLKPTGYLLHQQFNIQQLYALPALYLCVLYLSENKQRLEPLSIKCLVFITEMKSVYCAVRTGSLNKAVCASSLKG